MKQATDRIINLEDVEDVIFDEGLLDLFKSDKSNGVQSDFAKKAKSQGFEKDKENLDNTPYYENCQDILLEIKKQLTTIVDDTLKLNDLYRDNKDEEPQLLIEDEDELNLIDNNVIFKICFYFSVNNVLFNKFYKSSITSKLAEKYSVHTENKSIVLDWLPNIKEISPSDATKIAQEVVNHIKPKLIKQLN